jgi:gamma-glutamyltranspeptidase/glutathione hydrolase
MEKGGYVEVESGIPYEIVRELEKRGHEVRFDVGGYGWLPSHQSRAA